MNMGIDFTAKELSGFIETINRFILKSVEINGYFKLTLEEKILSQYFLHKLLKNNVRLSKKLDDNDLKNLIEFLRKKNEQMENYEMSQILFDLTNNLKIIDSVTNEQVN